MIFDMRRCYWMTAICAINLIAPGCLVTSIEGDPDPDQSVAINGLTIRTTCRATIECAPTLVFEWCASVNRHLDDASRFVRDFWADNGCMGSVLLGRTDCEAGGVPCGRRGLVEIIEP